jgi:hypothetical protein
MQAFRLPIFGMSLNCQVVRSAAFNRAIIWLKCWVFATPKNRACPQKYPQNDVQEFILAI